MVAVGALCVVAAVPETVVVVVAAVVMVVVAMVVVLVRLTVVVGNEGAAGRGKCKNCSFRRGYILSSFHPQRLKARTRGKAEWRGMTQRKIGVGGSGGTNRII